MKKVQYIFGALALITIPNWVQAQTQAKDTTLSRTVVVEQEYNPDIIDASKVNVLPKVMPPTVSKKTVEYDATLAPAGNIPATTATLAVFSVSNDKSRNVNIRPVSIRLICPSISFLNEAIFMYFVSILQR